MIRTFRYPLRPTAAQEATLDAWRRQCCDLYNAALQERRDAWKKQRVSIGYNAQTKSLTEWRAMDPDGAAVPAWVQRSALRRVDLVDRDHNAAVNICALGRSAVSWPEAFDPAQARSGLEAA